VENIAAEYNILNFAINTPFIAGYGFNQTYSLNMLGDSSTILSPCPQSARMFGNAKTAIIIGGNVTTTYNELINYFKCLNITVLANITCKNHYTTPEEYAPEVYNWRKLNPDIVISDDENVFLLATAIRKIEWNPIIIMLSLLNCADPPIELEYVLGYAPWYPTLPYSDPYFGASYELYENFCRFINYTAFDGGSGIVVIAALETLYFAINATQSLDSTVIRDYILTHPIDTFYGPIQFDVNNCLDTPPLCIQVQKKRRELFF